MPCIMKRVLGLHGASTATGICLRFPPHLLGRTLIFAVRRCSMRFDDKTETCHVLSHIVPDVSEPPLGNCLSVSFSYQIWPSKPSALELRATSEQLPVEVEEVSWACVSWLTFASSQMRQSRKFHWDGLQYPPVLPSFFSLLTYWSKMLGRPTSRIVRGGRIETCVCVAEWAPLFLLHPLNNKKFLSWRSCVGIP